MLSIFGTLQIPGLHWEWCPGTSIFNLPSLGCAFLLNFENYRSRDFELQEIVEQIGGLEISI